MKRIVVSDDFCKGCGICVHYCPNKVLKQSAKLSLRGAYPPIISDLERCTACRICEFYCPDFAIYVVDAE